jgi:transposase
MRKIREVLRLKFEVGLSDRQIAVTVGSARSTVQECFSRCRQAGIGWPLSADLSEEALQEKLYHRAVPLKRDVPTPDFATIHRELARRGVTRMLLWQEFKTQHPDGPQYTAFCNQYRRWCATQELVFRQVHAPGDKLFVDYAGYTVGVTDRSTGEMRTAQIFVAVLGASNLSFAEATWTQGAPDWLGSHVRALQFIGGVPRAVVPDNLKSGVTKAHRYEPDLNPAYQDFAEYYGLAILPARVRRPRDKAKVEAGVLVVERWILARLRHCVFFSLGELNSTLATLVEDMNNRPFKKLDGCRRSRFETLERAALRPLPRRAYEFGEWKRAKVHPDYHIQIERAYYSVPYRLIGARVEVRLTATGVEIFHQHRLVAAHARSRLRGKFQTLDAHRPAAHLAMIESTVERMLERAASIGPATVAVLRAQSQQRKHVEQTLRSAQGILRLGQDFSPRVLESACERALLLKTHSYRAVRTLIELPAPLPTPTAIDLPHANLRGPKYFQ